MAHPRDDEVYPVETVVRLHKTGEFAIIKDQVFLKDGMNFLYYLAEIEGRKGLYCVLHGECDLEALPPQKP